MPRLCDGKACGSGWCEEWVKRVSAAPQESDTNACRHEGGLAPETWPATPHYAKGRTIEPISVIEDWSKDWPPNIAFHLGNILKYVARMGRDGVDDLVTLKKAQSYLDRAIHVRIIDGMDTP